MTVIPGDKRLIMGGPGFDFNVFHKPERPGGDLATLILSIVFLQLGLFWVSKYSFSFQ